MHEIRTTAINDPVAGVSVTPLSPAKAADRIEVMLLVEELGEGAPKNTAYMEPYELILA